MSDTSTISAEVFVDVNSSSSMLYAGAMIAEAEQEVKNRVGALCAKYAKISARQHNNGLLISAEIVVY